METRIIEVNGVKLEVDLRDAKVIDSYKVGDNVKVLKKKYGDSYESHLGVIIGFDDFKTHPTIIVACLIVSYSSASIEFEYINSETKDVEICPINEWDIPFSKQDVLDKIDLDISKKKEELRDLSSKKKYFLHMFGKYFEKLPQG